MLTDGIKNVEAAMVWLLEKGLRPGGMGKKLGMARREQGPCHLPTKKTNASETLALTPWLPVLASPGPGSA
jgi:hypothetical protein